MRPITALILALALLVIAGCGDDDPDTSAVPDGSLTATTPPAEEPAEEEEPAEGGSETELGKKPAVEVPSGDPPPELESEDLVEGEGTAAKKGDTVSVQYVGVAYSTGEQFDASWDRGEPFEFELGGGRVIQGWDEGVVGMKPGGRRKLTIPPDQAYGEEGQPPLIGPSETLVFVIDLIEIS